ncbi:DUF1345 domain-containing protein [Polynucleobacter sp. AP-Melu-500A-A1]|uniref:DUF1345 domain-containing protein n=1 Tax=Polynucleobacter sp. AP-Melu-500A-A1 TaxID=2576929 RepID=UPI001C0E0DF0|nr:DUF1345 domain-containing protein [Polynucleobacter sp. AP-Melu-500A-A1]MBU3631238.1 DUF1345 domain-containing protein [Polynucleobacter sp. AP-Melu-500A-A1]
MKATHWSQYWHFISSTHRLLVVILVGLVAFFSLSTPSILVKLALAWIIASSLYVTATLIMMYFSTKENISGLSQKEDDGAPFILLITLFGAITSIGIIVMIMTNIKSLLIDNTAMEIGLVLFTYISSWFLIHTAFALHYAHVYYKEYEQTQAPPLIFPATLKPVYFDFLYFSMVLGMTCQTADVNIASFKMRYLAMIQGWIAFIFNTTLLVMTINLIYDLPNR